MRCTTCQREYPEKLPYCSERCATLDRDYVEATGYPAQLGSAEANNRRHVQAQLARWDARQADPVAPHRIDWAAKLAASPSMQYKHIG